MDVGLLAGHLQIYGQKVSLDDLKAMVRQFKFSNVVFTLAQINVLLSLKDFHPDHFSDLEGFLIANFIDDETLNHPEFINAQNSKQPFFGRHQILPLLRLCAFECSEEGTVIPDGKTEGGYLLGRCCLIMTDNLYTDESERKLLEAKDTPQERKELDLQIAPLFELHWPPDLERAVVRWDIMLSDILNSQAFNEKSRSLDLAARFHDISGITVETYRDFTFSVLMWYYGKELKEVQSNDHFLKFHRENLVSEMIIPQDEFERFLRIDGIRLMDLPAQLNAHHQQHPTILPYLDFGVFRRWPILELLDPACICIDPYFFIEKLGDGVHHTVRDVLQLESEKRIVSSKYGYLFQFYVDALLREVYSTHPEHFISFPDFGNRRAGTSEAFDGVIICPEHHLILLEYKGGFLKQEAKYSGELAVFEEELNKKFGTGPDGAISQMVASIERLFPPRREDRDYIPQLRDAGMEIPQVTEITPVLIVQEQFFRYGFNWYMTQMFQELAARSNISQSITVNQLQVIDIETLERIRPNLIAGDFRLEQVLKNRAAFDPEQKNMVPFYIHHAFKDFYGKRRDEKIDRRFDEIFNRIVRNFFGIDRPLEDTPAS